MTPIGGDVYEAQILGITDGSLDIGVLAYDNDENSAIRESFTIAWEDPTTTTSTGIPTTTTTTTTTPPVPLDPMIMAIAGVAAIIVVIIVVIVIKKR
jgi:hypothetical protein